MFEMTNVYSLSLSRFGFSISIILVILRLGAYFLEMPDAALVILDTQYH